LLIDLEERCRWGSSHTPCAQLDTPAPGIGGVVALGNELNRRDQDIGLSFPDKNPSPLPPAERALPVLLRPSPHRSISGFFRVDANIAWPKKSDRQGDWPGQSKSLNGTENTRRSHRLTIS
jgi:hypothetical protein